MTWFDQFNHVGPYRQPVADATALLGYACSQCYRTHPAFDETVEFSVYVASGVRSQGIGSRLYGALIRSLAHEQVHCIVAGITVPNDASVRSTDASGSRTSACSSRLSAALPQRVDSTLPPR